MITEIVVPVSAWQGDDDYDLIDANIEFVNTMFSALYLPEEIPGAALTSYYADYYLQQVENGGIAQFVYNSPANNMVGEALQQINALRHFALHQEVVNFAGAYDPEAAANFFQGSFFGDDQPMRDALNQFNYRFNQIQESESIMALNVRFLRELPEIRPLESDEFQKKMQALIDAVPDKAQRQAQADQLARDNQPEEERIVGEMCREVGCELVSINALSPAQYEGTPTLEWHFSTSTGHYHAIFHKGEALLFQGWGKEIVARRPFPFPSQ